jgi:hypothetical protein
MQVYEYPGIEWRSPTFGGSYQRGDEFPCDVSAVVVEKPCAVVDQTLIVNCSFNGRSHRCFFKASDEGTAKGLAFWLDQLVGQTLDKFGDFPLDL